VAACGRLVMSIPSLSQSKENMLFAATAVANGAGVGIVNSIGMATEIGKIQAQITEAAAEEDDTPLKKKIDEFGEMLAKVGFCRRCVPSACAPGHGCCRSGR